MNTLRVIERPENDEFFTPVTYRQGNIANTT